MVRSAGGSGPWCWLVALVLVAVVIADRKASAAAIDKRNVESQFSLKDKRPFCNAFTGCGRKRSAGGAALPPLEGSPEQLPGSSSSSSSHDTRHELDELARHALAQARLWDQLQQRVELMRSFESGYPEPDAAPLYRRKRGAGAPSPSYGGAGRSPRQHKRQQQAAEQQQQQQQQLDQAAAAAKQEESTLPR